MVATFAILVACGSDGRPAAMGDGAGDDTDTDTDIVGGEGGIAADGGEGGAMPPPPGDGGYVPPDLDGGPVLVCPKQSAVFNLTYLGPAQGMPEAFVRAWDHEVGVPVDESKMPAMVLAGNNLQSGPVQFRIGGVVWNGSTKLLPAAGAGAANIAVTPSLNRIALSRTATTFQLGFGTLVDRRTVDVVAVALDLEVISGCDFALGSVTLEVAGSSANVAFGDGTTLGDVLGPFNVDTDNNTSLDGWIIELVSNRGAAPDVGPLP